MESNRPRFDDSVSQMIRSAERFISQRKFSYAREQLGVAQTLDPRNSYIDAIMARLAVLEEQASAPLAASSLLGQAASSNEWRHLSVSVGPQFADGIREQDTPLAPAEIQTRVRQLTNMAERLLERGSAETAFDTLMKAYLLDPVSPYVVSCEKSVLPAWRQLHHQESVLHSFPSSFQEGEPVNITRTSPPQDLADQEKRLETLRHRKEMERLERERAVWRNASNPPAGHGVANATEKQESGTTGRIHDEDRSLFSKLKRGKFLNQ
jgi:hypothetical protein